MLDDSKKLTTQRAKAFMIRSSDVLQVKQNFAKAFCHSKYKRFPTVFAACHDKYENFGVWPYGF
jgi:hypothetical protein